MYLDINPYVPGNVSNAVSIVHGGFYTSLGLAWISYYNSYNWFCGLDFDSISGVNVLCCTSE